MSKDDWSIQSINFQSGCEYDCLYCYAKGMAQKFKQPAGKHWGKPKIRMKDVNYNQRCYKDQPVMFPSSHDLTLNNRRLGYVILDKLLKERNQVLIVTKPKVVVISEICQYFAEYKDQIEFRFTITSMDNDVLKKYEPRAPCFEERFNCLRHAFRQGFTTSVSCEPILNASCVYELFRKLESSITNHFWLGIMEPYICKNPVSDSELRALYGQLKDAPKVMWKTDTKKHIQNLIKGATNENMTPIWKSIWKINRRIESSRHECERVSQLGTYSGKISRATRLSTFPISIANDLYNLLDPKSIIDPCTGQGGRIVAARMLSIPATGYDVSPETIKTCRLNYQEYADNFIVNDSRHLPLNDNAAELVFLVRLIGCWKNTNLCPVNYLTLRDTQIS